MSFLTRAATSALTGLAIFGFASAAFATTPSNPVDHAALAQAVSDAGVTFIENHDYCHSRQDGGKLFGFYSGTHRVMVVCPENADKGERNVEWTEEDYDTLRHETVHLLQDCADGEIDGDLISITGDPTKTGIDLLGFEDMASIYETYTARGASLHIVRMEWEAFGLASLNQPKAQTEAVRAVCGVK